MERSWPRNLHITQPSNEAFGGGISAATCPGGEFGKVVEGGTRNFVGGGFLETDISVFLEACSSRVSFILILEEEVDIHMDEEKGMEKNFGPHIIIGAKGRESSDQPCGAPVGLSWAPPHLTLPHQHRPHLRLLREDIFHCPVLRPCLLSAVYSFHIHLWKHPLRWCLVFSIVVESWCFCVHILKDLERKLLPRNRNTLIEIFGSNQI